jgi:hypothetical protein
LGVEIGYQEMDKSAEESLALLQEAKRVNRFELGLKKSSTGSRQRPGPLGWKSRGSSFEGDSGNVILTAYCVSMPDKRENIRNREMKTRVVSHKDTISLRPGFQCFSDPILAHIIIVDDV